MPRRVHLLSLTAATMILTVMVAQPILPLYLQARGLPLAEVGLLVGLLSLSLIVTELGALAISSMIGRRWIIILGALGGAATQLWFALAEGRPEWYLSRLLFGAFRGMMWPVLFSEVADATPPDRHGPAFALFWFYFGLGLFVGPWVGGWLAEALGLRAPLLAAAALALAPALAIGAVGARRDAPIPFRRSLGELVRRREVAALWALNALSTTSFGLFATFLPLHAAAHGLAPGQIGLLFAVGSAAFTLSQWPAGRLLARGAGARILAASYLMRGIAFAAVPLLGGFAGLMALNAFLGAVGAFIPPTLSARLAGATPPAQSMVAMGVFNAAADVGFFLGPAAGGLVAGFGLAWPFLLALPLTLAAAALIRRTLRPVVAACDSGSDP